MKVILVIVILCITSGSCSVSRQQTSFRWSAKVFHVTKDFQFVPSKLSTANAPVPSISEIDLAAFPQDLADQVLGLEHRATPYIVKVEIVDHTQLVSDIAMRSLVNSGNIPNARLSYPSPSGKNLDSGNSLLKIHGMIYNMDNKNSTGSCLIFPIPINEELTQIKFHLPTASCGPFLLQSVSKTFHVMDLAESTAMEYFELPPHQKRTWLPDLSNAAHVMTLSISENIFLTSFDEFETVQVQKVVEAEGDSAACPDADGTMVSIGKYILHLRKAGPQLLKATLDGRWEDMKSSHITFDNNGKCLTKVASLPPTYSKDLLAASNSKTVYIGQMDKNGILRTALSPGSNLHMKELLSADGISICKAAAMTRDSCKVVSLAFEPSSCCKLFVLLQAMTDAHYVLLEYTDVANRYSGKWNKLAKMSNVLPIVEDNPASMVFLNPNEQYKGFQFHINGISTLTRPDGVVYIWGDVLLVYDIRSRLLALIPSFLPSTGSAKDTAILLSSANSQGIYSILTKNGGLWIGAAYPFEKHYSQLLKAVLELSTEEYMAVFFDSLDTLYGVTYHFTNGEYKFTREQIEIQDKFSEECSRIYDCPRLFLQCDAESSAFHINHTAYSRMRHFSVKPPALMPKAQKDEFGYPVHSKKTLLTYLTVMERFFTGQKISKPKWWLIDDSNQLQDWWYTQNTKLEEYRKYLAVANLLPNDPIVYLSKRQFHHETIRPPHKYESWDTSFCSLPSVIYLDKNEEYRFNVTIKHSLSATVVDFENLRLVTISSDNTLLNVTTIRHLDQFNVLYEVIVTGQEMTHKPPGKLLTTVSVIFYPWTAPPSIPDIDCCSGISEGMAFEQSMLVKVGCPPAKRLKFDTQSSLDILFSRGRTDNFECLHDGRDNIPCFTTSEFAAAFYVEDFVTGEQSPFEGNYTLQVVAGGTGYLENVREYDEEEIKAFNYRPGDSKSLLSLIWSLLLESSSKGMRDEKTGRLIFDAKNPASIVFECRLDSPCGNIPFGAANPGEFYLEIEVSNKGVDSSTNCDYTMRFMIHLIGVELSPRVHLMLMMITLSILTLLIFAYYGCKFAGGYRMLRKLMKKEEIDSDSEIESEYAEPPPHFREALTRRLTIGGIQNPTLQGGGARRPSLLVQGLMHDAERGKKRSSVRVHGVLNTKSHTSDRTLNG